jgi:hypothetical protein
MPLRFVVVSGLPASGKSTIGRAIAKAMQLPFLDKDHLLEGLFDSHGVGDSAWRTKLSRTADEELRRQAGASLGAVMASWWRHPRSTSASGTPITWLTSLPGELVELHCNCSPNVAVDRFVSPNRHPGHLDGRYNRLELLATFEEQRSLGPLALGRIVQIDTESSPPISDALTQLSDQFGERSPRGYAID